MGKRSTTALIRITHRKSVSDEKVTPAQVRKSEWLKSDDARGDGEEVLVKIAVERVLRRLHRGQRVMAVDVEPAGSWSAYLPGLDRVYTGSPWLSHPRGKWESADGDRCMAAARGETVPPKPREAVLRVGDPCSLYRWDGSEWLWEKTPCAVEGCKAHKQDGVGLCSVKVPMIAGYEFAVMLCPKHKKQFAEEGKAKERD